MTWRFVKYVLAGLVFAAVWLTLIYFLLHPEAR